MPAKRPIVLSVLLFGGLPAAVLLGTAACSRKAVAEGPPPATWAQGVARAKVSNLACGKCHKEAEEDWRRSDHSKANRMVHPEADGPPFAGLATSTHAGDFRFEMDGARQPVIRESRKDGSVHEYKPSMVLAYRPLQQYLVEIEPGRFQTTDVAWDPAKKEWFSVYGTEERNPGEWGHWLGRGMNWNSMCARCHMTGYAKNYEPATDRYSSGWIEHGIGCIQCHNTMPGHEPGGDAMKGIDNFARDPQRMMQSCAPCHSRAESLTAEFTPGEVYDDHFRLQLPVEPTLYYPDGQILDEVFVFASFRHSKMHAAGVTCMDCHNPHSGALKLPQETNATCMQCHTAPGRLGATVIDPTAHSFHKADSTGNRCVECHMVETTYMQRDPRRDHGFIIPDPVMTKELGVPNACSRCHADKPLEWSIEAYEKWYGPKMEHSRHRERTRAVAAAFRGERDVVARLLALIDNEKVPAWRASLLTLADRVAPAAPEVIRAAIALRDDPEPLIRAASIRALALDPASRPFVEAALKDPVRLVRLDAAWPLSPSLPEGSPIRSELDAYIRDALDQPGGRYRMAQELFNRGRPAEAAAMLRPALKWDPLSPAMPEAMGFMLSAQGKPAEAARELERAAELAPDNALMPMHAALAWSEAGDLQRAESMLGMALRRDRTLARAWYNLGLLQAQTGRAEQAVVSLREAGRLEPLLADFPYALSTVLAQLGRTDEAIAALERALTAEPGHAASRQLLERLRR